MHTGLSSEQQDVSFQTDCSYHLVTETTARSGLTPELPAPHRDVHLVQDPTRDLPRQPA